MNSLHSQGLPARCDWQSFPRKSRAVTVKTNGIGTGALGLSGYCSRTMCIDKTSAPYCPFNGMRDEFMAPIHFLTAILCNIFTSPLRSRPRARQCWLWWVKRPIKFSPSRDGEPAADSDPDDSFSYDFAFKARQQTFDTFSLQSWLRNGF